MTFVQWLTTYNDAIVSLANIVIAVGTVILAFGIPVSIVYSVRAKRDMFYATLDKTYFDIQKAIIENPHLANPDPAGKTPEQIAQYDAFAFIVWNFVESIFDYAETDKVLRETWDCILRYESTLHGAWFDEERNHAKFKERFIQYIDREHCTRKTHATN